MGKDEEITPISLKKIILTYFIAIIVLLFLSSPYFLLCPGLIGFSQGENGPKGVYMDDQTFIYLEDKYILRR